MVKKGLMLRAKGSALSIARSLLSAAEKHSHLRTAIFKVDGLKTGGGHFQVRSNAGSGDPELQKRATIRQSQNQKIYLEVNLWI